MKITEKKKPISTTPKGAWESGIINNKNTNDKCKNPNELTTDLQGNGYPLPQKKRNTSNKI